MIDKLFLMIKNFRREITDSSFTRAYGDYLNKRLTRLKGKDDEHLVKGFQLLDILKEQEGLTQEELDKYLDSYSAFEEFWNDKGYDLCLDMPNYKSYKPTVNSKMSFDDISKQEGLRLKDRKKVRDNMLIDMISAGLSSNAGSQMSMIPGSYIDIKHASRVQQIAKDPKALTTFIVQHKSEIERNGLYNTLNKYGRDSEKDTTKDSISALEKFHEKNATIEDPLSIIDYSENHRNLMDGNDLIGIFAVSSSSHYKFQFINNGGGLSIANNYQFNISIDGETTLKVDRIDAVVSPFTGAKIGDYCAQYQAASPDNGKDPVLGDINANPNTASRIEFLTRIGLDPNTVGVLNTCDDFLGEIKDIVFEGYGDSGFKEDYDNWQKFHGSIPRIFDLVSKYRLQGISSFSVEEMSEAAQFLGWMNNIKKLSKLLGESSSIARCDSPNGALAISTAEVTQQLIKAKTFMEKVTKRENGRLIANPSSPIQGFEQFIDTDLDAIYDDNVREKILNSAVPRVQASYTLGIRSGYTLASKFNMLPQLSKSVEEAVEYLRNSTKSTLVYKNDTKELRQFYNELVTYLLSGEDSRFGTSGEEDIMSKRNYYIHDFPMKYKIFMNQKTKNGKYRHDRVRNMTLFKCLRVSEKDGITFQNVGKVSPQMRKVFSEELDQLLTSTDPEEVQFAEDLFNYAYYANGFNFGPHNYGIFLSNAYYENMPKYLEVLKARNTQLAIAGKMDDYLVNFVHQFLANNPDYVPKVHNATKYFNFEKNEQTGEVKMSLKNGMNTNQRSSALDMVSTMDSVSTVPIIVVQNKYYGGMYYRVSRAVDDPVFVKIQFNKLSTPFYDSSKDVTEIQYNQMEKFGNPSNIKKVMEIMDNEKKKSEKNDETEVIKELSTTGELEESVESTADAANNLDSIEGRNEEPENLGDITPTESEIDEDALEKAANAMDEAERKQVEFENKIKALSDRVEELEKKLEDFETPPSEDDINMCDGK